MTSFKVYISIIETARSHAAKKKFNLLSKLVWLFSIQLTNTYKYLLKVKKKLIDVKVFLFFIPSVMKKCETYSKFRKFLDDEERKTSRIIINQLEPIEFWKISLTLLRTSINLIFNFSNSLKSRRQRSNDFSSCSSSSRVYFVYLTRTVLFEHAQHRTRPLTYNRLDIWYMQNEQSWNSFFFRLRFWNQRLLVFYCTAYPNNEDGEWIKGKRRVTKRRLHIRHREREEKKSKRYIIHNPYVYCVYTWPVIFNLCILSSSLIYDDSKLRVQQKRNRHKRFVHAFRASKWEDNRIYIGRH